VYTLLFSRSLSPLDDSFVAIFEYFFSKYPNVGA
jgi:hypothetical protein